MRHEAIAIKGEALPARRFTLRRVSELELKPAQWSIRGYLEADSLALIFGDPGCGKSFLAIDWACAIATGREWHGKKVKQAPVIYIAGEGLNNFSKRMHAWAARHQIKIDDIAVHVSDGPASLCDVTEANEVTAAVDALIETHGAPGLVVIDTVARNFGPGDENSTQDMTAFIAAADAIRTRYRCTVLLVHHTGHADKSRARGAMALKGALDAEYRLDKDEDGVIRFEATKMKDAEPPEPMAFRLRTVELPLVDDEGQPVTSAILDPTSYEPPPKRGKAGRGKWQTVALEVLAELHKEHRQNRQSGGRDPEGARVSVEDWRNGCLDRGMPKQRFYDLRRSLPEQLLVRIEHGFAYLE